MCWLFPGEYSDFAGLSQSLDDLGFIVGIMDAGLPELAGVAVLLPVVVPVPAAVSPKTKHVHLAGGKECRKMNRGENKINRKKDLQSERE